MNRPDLHAPWIAVLVTMAISDPCDATSIAPPFVAHDVFFTGKGEVGLAGSYPNIGGVIRFLSIKGQATRDLTIHNRTVSCATISSDGLVMASAGDVWTTPCELFLSNPSTGEVSARLKGHVGCVVSLVISPNTQVLATGGGQAGGPDVPGELILWDLPTASIAHRLVGHSGMVFGVAFSPDGQSLASASADGTVRIWNVKDGTIQAVLSGHRDRVTSLAFQPDGSRLASGSGAWGGPGEVRFWNAQTWQLERAVTFGSWVNSVAFAPDGSRLAFGGGHGNLFGAIELTQNFRVINCRSSRRITEEVHSLAFSTDGQLLAIGGQSPSPEVRNAVFTAEPLIAGPQAAVLYGVVGLAILLSATFLIRRWRPRMTTKP